MEEHRYLDVTHIFFLELIQRSLRDGGAVAATDLLMKTAIDVAERFPPQDFASIEEFSGAIEDLVNPIARCEGRAERIEGGVFALERCPFSASVRSYQSTKGDVPALQEITDEFNRPGPLREEFHVGHGAAVCAFCVVHQTLRCALARRITIGGKPIRVYQLGCKTFGGAKAFADRFIAEAGVDRERVVAILDNHTCCYAVVTE